MSKYRIILFVILGLVILYLTHIQINVYDTISTPQDILEQGFVIQCDELLLEPPINCRLVDATTGIIVPNEIIYEKIDHGCWAQASTTKHTLPCRIPSGDDPLYIFRIFG